MAVEAGTPYVPPCRHYFGEIVSEARLTRSVRRKRWSWRVCRADESIRFFGSTTAGLGDGGGSVVEKSGRSFAWGQCNEEALRLVRAGDGDGCSSISLREAKPSSRPEVGEAASREHRHQTAVLLQFESGLGGRFVRRRSRRRRKHSGSPVAPSGKATSCRRFASCRTKPIQRNSAGYAQRFAQTNSARGKGIILDAVQVENLALLSDIRGPGDHRICARAKAR